MQPGIIYEDEYLMAVAKPAGMMVHSDGRSDEYTLADWISENRPEVVGVGENMEIDGKEIKRPGIVHRLDRDTTGVVVIAKNQETFLFLKRQFKGHKIKKRYEAIVWGHVARDFGTIDAPIGRSKSDFRQWSASRGARGEKRDAKTRFQVIKRFVYDDEDGEREKYTHIALYPLSGRTHQLRVHMKFINHPIIGDKLYGAGKKTAFDFDRPALHAKELTITHPKKGETKFLAPYPKDLEEALAAIANS